MNPLEQLQDIALPENIHNYPVALGWWLAAIIFLIVLTVVIITAVKYFNARKVKKSALTALKNNTLDEEGTHALLKWACLQYFARTKVAPLYGENFFSFLTEQLPLKQQSLFIENYRECFQTRYQTNEKAQPNTTEQVNNTEKVKNTEQVNAKSKNMAKFWLNYALPPKTNSQTSAQISHQKNIATAKQPLSSTNSPTTANIKEQKQ